LATIVVAKSINLIKRLLNKALNHSLFQTLELAENKKALEELSQEVMNKLAVVKIDNQLIRGYLPHCKWDLYNAYLGDLR
jgi:hypothetical protein